MSDLEVQRRLPGGRRFPPITATDAVSYFLRFHGVRVSPATIRQWASRKRIGSYGCGRARYDLREIEAYAAQIGLVARDAERS